MVAWILKKILGSKNQRELKRLRPIVHRINEFDEQFKSLSDDELRAKTATWKEELAKISDAGGAMEEAGRNFAGSLRGGEKRGPASEGATTQLSRCAISR